MVWVKKGSGRVGAGSAGSSRKQGELQNARRQLVFVWLPVGCGGRRKQGEQRAALNVIKHLVWLQMSGGQLQYVVYHLLLH